MVVYNNIWSLFIYYYYKLLTSEVQLTYALFQAIGSLVALELLDLATQ